MIRDRVRERYEQDSTFKAVVDMLRATVVQYRLTPHEIREAAMLAVIMEDERNPSPIVVSLNSERDIDLIDEIARRNRR